MLRLKELRKAKGLTTTELGEIIGCSNPTITNYERGNRKPDPETLIKLADYFGVSVDYLLGRDNVSNFANVADSQEFSADERELVAAFRELTPDLQAMIWGLLRSWTGERSIVKTDLQKKA